MTLLKRARVSLILIGGAAFASAALARHPREFRPRRFQVGGFVSRCWPGTDGFAAECEALKTVGEYTVRIGVGDDRFDQSIDHPTCKPDPDSDFDSIQYDRFRDELFNLSESERRRLMVRNFERMARRMAKACPKLRPLNRAAYQIPPDLNAANDTDLSAPVRPPRFQVGGWVTTCWPGAGNQAAHCAALKKIGDYRLRMFFGGGGYWQSIERSGCQDQVSIRRDKPWGGTAEDRRRWTVKGFEQLKRDIAETCPKVWPLDLQASLNPPDPKITGDLR